MRYSPEHKQAVHQRIVQTAAERIKSDGFAASGVDTLMADAQLTSGSFYRHFQSKDALLSEVIASELERSRALFTHATDLTAILKRYLHMAHVQSPQSGCALPSLTPEIARASEQTRQAFTDGLHDLLAQLQDTGASRNDAVAALSAAVGAVMLARACNDEQLQRELLKACRSTFCK